MFLYLLEEFRKPSHHGDDEQLLQWESRRNKKYVLIFAGVNSISYLCSTERRNATVYAVCDANNPTEHRALLDYT